MNSKIFIYGVPGAGKTSFSTALKAKLGYPLVEADYLRGSVAQVEKSREQDPFVYLGTTEAWQELGAMTPGAIVDGLQKVRNSMWPYVKNEIVRHADDLIMEAAFLNPNKVSEYGQPVLVVTSDELAHERQYFEHRERTAYNLETFKAARVIQGYLLTEVQKQIGRAHV